MRLILASQSPSRRRLLEGAGLHPEIIVSNVDEETEHFNSMSPVDMVIALAITKAHTVREMINGDAIIVACDSTFEFDGKMFGKPLSKQVAIERAKAVRGHFGLLHTGQCVIDTKKGIEVSDISTSRVYFADMTDHEIESYVNTGEPLEVAGGFTLDGLSAPYISKIEGDPSGIIGLSLPLLRKAVINLGLKWEELA